MELYFDPNSNPTLIKFATNFSEDYALKLNSTTNLELEPASYSNSQVVCTDNIEVISLADTTLTSPIFLSTPDLILTAESAGIITSLQVPSLCSATNITLQEYKEYKQDNTLKVAEKWKKILYRVNQPEKDFTQTFRDIFKTYV